MLLNKVKQTRVRGTKQALPWNQGRTRTQELDLPGVNALQLRALGSDFKAMHTGQGEPAPTVVP